MWQILHIVSGHLDTLAAHDNSLITFDMLNEPEYQDLIILAVFEQL